MDKDVLYERNGYQAFRSRFHDPDTGYGVEDSDGNIVLWFDDAEEAIEWVEES